ncbi:MAG: hypothetical protein NTZ05_05300 [Chloroflexi bacterium]|nr:hypothetical protein [Chloroflexota bacterium]
MLRSPCCDPARLPVNEMPHGPERAHKRRAPPSEEKDDPAQLRDLGVMRLACLPL